MIPTLIDKQDNFEIIRDQIAAILVTESANQEALAIAASKDPLLWKLRVYEERTNPWEKFNQPGDDGTPIVNVWFENSDFDMKASNLIERQSSRSIFNIDCYGYGVSKDNPAGGHTPGDKDAAFEAQRTIRLVRNILMAAEYMYLGFQGLVWSRKPQSINVFQPRIDERNVSQVVAARIAFNVVFNEFSPQVAEETLCYLAIDVNRAEDGQLVVEADYDYENVDFP